MFTVYNLVYYKNHQRYSEWFLELEFALKRVHDFDYWFLEKNEIIEGLYYPQELIARSAYAL